jgi:hypothetical protein
MAIAKATAYWLHYFDQMSLSPMFYTKRWGAKKDMPVKCAIKVILGKWCLVNLKTELVKYKIRNGQNRICVIWLKTTKPPDIELKKALQMLL